MFTCFATTLHGWALTRNYVHFCSPTGQANRVALELPAARLYEARKTTKRRLEIELANE